MIIINQGKPSSPYFGVLQTENKGLLKVGEIVTCVNKRKNIETIAQVVGVYTYKWSEYPDLFFLILFGFNVEDYRKSICNTFPEFINTEKVKVFILIELNPNDYGCC